MKGVWEVGWALAPVEDNAQQLHSLLTAEVLTDTQLQVVGFFLIFRWKNIER